LSHLSIREYESFVKYDAADPSRQELLEEWFPKKPAMRRGLTKEKEFIMQPNLWSSVRAICDQLIVWQAPSGGINIETCPYHRPPLMVNVNSWNQDIPWLVRALYAFYDFTGEPVYKGAADRYAVFFIAAMHPKKPAYSLGGAIEPCYKLYREHNPMDDSLDAKAKAMYQWLLGYRTDKGNYINCGYGGGANDTEDVAFSCDLSDVGRGFVAFYQMFSDKEALEHAIGLARFYLTEAESGSMQGVWSSKLGTWLIGPRHIAGFENLSVHADEAGWGWSTYYASLYLARLYDCVKDERLKADIRNRCVTSLQWFFDACQFDDGAIGMSGRDDKWLGQTAMAILQYLELCKRAMIDREFHRVYYPKALKSLAWLREVSEPARFPPDGYIPVTVRSTTTPGCNTVWQLALTVEGLLAGPALGSLCLAAGG
jgi:hypothetical protein